jgi:hypothetical protein
MAHWGLLRQNKKKLIKRPKTSLILVNVTLKGQHLGFKADKLWLVKSFR